MTDQIDISIKELIKSGKTYVEIAEKLGVGYTRIAKNAKILRESGIIIPRTSPRTVQSTKKDSSSSNRTTLPTRSFIISPDEILFLEKLIIKKTHQRFISQDESLKSIEILNKLKYMIK